MGTYQENEDQHKDNDHISNIIKVKKTFGRFHDDISHDTMRVGTVPVTSSSSIVDKYKTKLKNVILVFALP